ncbi:MAG: seg [Candidatus Kaiserbacteria bacterium]|nr:seg [Candidatus Kaiserbacteria bacterium]
MRNALLFALILFVAVPAYAQFSIPGADSAVSISTAPAYPGPNASVTLTVQSALYDVGNGTITWTAGGRVIAQGVGATEAHIVTGPIGSATQVQVTVSGDNGTASRAITITPASIDLLWESDSYTPPFYRGRALSSAGSSVTVVAIPHLVRSGSAIPPETLTYTWKKDGAVVSSASGRGKSTAVFDGPMLYGTSAISVTAASSDGTLAANGILRIPDTAPRLMLYEDTPLFGILYNKALVNTTYIPETEMSFTVVPFFGPTVSATDPRLEYAWTVNGTSVTPDPAKPYEITINAEKSTGIANIGLELTHSTNYFLDAQGSWGITFSNSAARGGSGGAADPFHQ